MTYSPSTAPGTTIAQVSAAEAPYPVVVVEGCGRVVGLNEAACELLPDLRAGQQLSEPAWLARADTQPASGMVGERFFQAHPTPSADGTTAWWLVDDSERRSAMRELEVERDRTGFLVHASSALLSSLNLEKCMETTARLATEHLADAAIVIAPSTGRKLPTTTCDQSGRLSRGTTPASAPRNVPGLVEALQGFPPVPSRWIDPAAAPSWMVPAGFGEVGSIAITPLPGHGVPAGALILLRKNDHRAFSEAEESLAGLFAARAGAAMSAARLYAEQNSITETLMRELLPPTLRHHGGVEFAGGYRPSRDHERVGGDFYDVHLPDGEHDEALAVLGDVCGKGLDAAVLTGKIRNTLHALVPMADDHERTLRMLNSALLDSEHTRFATLVLASVRRDGSNVALRVTSAGHPPPLVVRGNRAVEEVDTRGSLVGALPSVTASTAEVTLAPGETCLLFTDGITEAKGGPLGDVLFGEQRLERALRECAGMPAEAVVERVQMLASEWVGDGGHDDMAVLAITAPHGAHLSAVDGHTPGRYTA